MQDKAMYIIFCVSLEGSTGGLELRGGTYKSGNVFITNSNAYHGPVCDDLWHNVDAGVRKDGRIMYYLIDNIIKTAVLS